MKRKKMMDYLKKLFQSNGCGGKNKNGKTRRDM